MTTEATDTPPQPAAVGAHVDRGVGPQREWVAYNHLTHCYETRDGTAVAAELVDGAQCVADVLHITTIREQQRVAMRPNAKAEPALTARGKL